MTIFQKAPGTLPRRRIHLTGPAGPAATALLFLVALCSLALADDPIFHVARISLVEGEVSYQRSNSSGSSGDSGKDWFDATLNLPLEENDQIYSGSDGRAEIQLSGRNVVRISRDTNLRFTQFSPGAIQMALPVGSAYFRIDSLDKRQFEVVDANDAGINDPLYFEVDTPTVAVTFVKEGVYRINVEEDGSTEVIVRQGQAEVYGQEIGTVVVKKGKRVVVEGHDDLYRLSGLEDQDDWDRWNEGRDNGLFSGVDSSNSARYMPAAVPGVYDLDNYGEWIDTPEYGRMWCPRGVAADWAPYRDGYWRWFPSYGWTWISYEPWGWAPYHYGRWAYVRERWCWAPVVNIGPVFAWRWQPHHVAFFGWGGSYNRGFRDGYYDGYWKGFRDGRYGYLGWCPLGPRDRHYGPKDNAPRLEALGNFHAPGAVSGMDARRFAGGRAAVSRDALNAPREELIARLRGEREGRGREKGFAAPAFVRNEDLKPLQSTAPTRSDAVARGRFARRIESPIVFRRTPSGVTPPGWRPIREGRPRDGKTTPAPVGQGGDPNRSAPSRIPNERIDRPSRMPDYKRPERVDAPPPRPRESGESKEPREPRERDRTRSERAIERDNENNRPPRDEAPSRNERRSDDGPRREGPPEWRRGGRREEPHDPAPNRETRRADPPRDSSPPRNDDTPRRNDSPELKRNERREADYDQAPHREMRRADQPSRDNSPPRETRRDDQPRDNSPHREMRRPDPPSHDNSPPRSAERPSSPPPQSAPARAPERPSSPPPARESSPQRPAERPAERSPERSAPTRRPNIQ